MNGTKYFLLAQNKKYTLYFPNGSQQAKILQSTPLILMLVVCNSTQTFQQRCMSLDTWPPSKDNVNYTLGPSIQHELLFYFYLEEYIYEGIFLWLQASKILQESKFGQALFSEQSQTLLYLQTSVVFWVKSFFIKGVKRTNCGSKLTGSFDWC